LTLIWEYTTVPSQNTFYQTKTESLMTYENLMTMEEVANYLKVKKRTIYGWVKNGKIPAMKTVGQWRFKKENIDAWLEQKQRG